MYSGSFMNNFSESFSNKKQKVEQSIPENLNLSEIISNLLSSNPSQLKSSTLSFLNVSKSKLSDSVESIKDKALTKKASENSIIDDSLVIS